MEAVGLAVAIPPLVSLCVDALDSVENFRKYESHSRQLTARFDAAKTRLEQWSRAAGIDDDVLLPSHHSSLDNPEVAAVVRDLLFVLYKTFDDTANVTRQLARQRDDILSAQHGQTQPLHLTTGLKSLKRSIRSKGSALSWALRGKSVYTDQVQMFESLMDSLSNLVPIDRDLGQQDATAQQAVALAKSEACLQEARWRTDQMYGAALRNMYDGLRQWLNAPLIDQELEKHVHARVEGTCEWISADQAYQKWQSEEFPQGAAKLFWLYGPPGFGKTVLCATIATRVNDASQTPMAYFLSGPHVRSGSRPHHIARSWMSQLISHSKALDLVHGRWTSKHGSPVATQADVWDLLRETLRSIDGCTLVLDALDEFPSIADDRREFLQKLKEVVADTSTRVLISSRLEDDIESELSTSNPPEALSVYECRITPKQVRGDTHLLATKMVAEQLPRKDKALQQELVERLSQKCDGQFLWMKLLKPQLRAGKNKKQLLEIVDATPHTLPQAYQRHWDAVQTRSPDDRHRAMALLRWVCFAVRPLTVEELTEALAHEPGVGDSCQDNMPDEIDDEYIDGEIKGLCAAFIEVTPGSGSSASRAVQLVHASAKDFLITALPHPESSLNATPGISLDANHHIHLAEVCLRYLNCDWSWPDGELDIVNGQELFGLRFMKYASKSWRAHQTKANISSTEYERLTVQLFDPNSRHFAMWANHNMPRQVEWTQPCFETGLNAVLYAAVTCELAHVVEHLRAHDQIDFTPVSFEMGTSLQVAASKDGPFFEDFLAWGADVHTKAGAHGSALGSAVVASRLKHSQILLDCGVDVRVRSWEGSSILALAARTGNLDMMRSLLKYGADPADWDDFRVSPLFAAIQSEDSATVSLMLRHGASITGTDSDGQGYLFDACRTNNLEIVSLLLEHGADVATRDRYGLTVLHLACSCCDIEVVSHLLDRGADVHARTRSEKTAIHIASEEGRRHIVSFLLDRESSEGPPRGSHRNALSADMTDPTGVSHADGERGVCASSRAAWSRAYHPLQAAVVGGSIDVVRLLIAKGAPLDVGAMWGAAPLQLAAARKNVEMVDELVKAGADLMSGEFWQDRTVSELLEQTFLGHEKLVEWRSSALAQPRDSNHKQMVKKAICDMAQELLHSTNSNPSDRIFNWLEVCFGFLDASADRVFVANCQPVRIGSDGVLEHVTLVCDACDSDEPCLKGERWTCLSCPDRDYCGQCRNKLSNADDPEIRKCAGHELAQITGCEYGAHESTLDGPWAHISTQDFTQNPVRRQWLEDLLVRYKTDELPMDLPSDTANQVMRPVEA